MITTRPGTADPEELIAGISDQRQRQDSGELVRLFSTVTGEPAVLWGDSIIGFGRYRYKYASGHEGESFLIGFSPRRREFSLYLMGCHLPDAVPQRDPLLARLGKHRLGKGCLYVKRLADVDTEILGQLAALSVEYLKKEYPT